LSTLLAAALIEYDGNRPPRGLFLPALLIGVIAALIWPYLRPVPAWSSLPDWTCRIVDGIAGLAAGGLLGYLAWRIQGTRSPGGLTWGLLCVGVFLGWQAVGAIAFVIMIFALVAMAFGRPRKWAEPGPFTVWLYPVTLGWILAWSWIVDLIK
jgi:prepilin signal peptidase PulO-like enzyme (type II secretory pathway)